MEGCAAVLGEKSGRIKAEAQGQSTHRVESEDEKHPEEENRGTAETWHAGGRSWSMIDSWSKMEWWMECFWLLLFKKKGRALFSHTGNWPHPCFFFSAEAKHLFQCEYDGLQASSFVLSPKKNYISPGKEKKKILPKDSFSFSFICFYKSE